MKFALFRSIVSFWLSFGFLLSSFTAASANLESTSPYQDDPETAITNAFMYLAAQMNNDGGIRWMDETSSAAVTVRVVLALAAAGYPQDTLKSNAGNRPIDYVAANASEWINDPGAETSSFNLARAGQVLTAIAAANENPHAFGPDKLDLIGAIKANYEPSSAVFGNSTPENVIDQVWSILGLAASHASIAPDAAEWLASAQGEDGSWNDGYGSFLDTTPLAIMALIASGHRDQESPEIHKALNFIASNQQPDGGWKTEWDSTTNANTTGVMLQAITAIGHRPTDDAWQQESSNPQTALLVLQKENGAIGGDFINAFSTADAILGLSGNPFFNLGVIRRVNLATDYLISKQESDGGWGSVGQTIDVMLALKAAGWDPNTVTKNNQTPLSFLQANLGDYLLSGPDAIGKTLLAATANGIDPTNFARTNLITELMNTYNPDTSAFGDQENTWHQAFAILGLSASNQEVPEGAISILIQLQQEDGGWEYAVGFGTWPDNTALAIQALLGAGLSADDDVITKANGYLQSTQTKEGDWGDSSSTSYVLMALNALETPPEDWPSISDKNPQQTLFTYQNDNGAFVFNWDFPEDNLMATATAVFAIMSGDYLVTPPDNDEINYAGLVIIPDKDHPQTVCVPYSRPSISGLELIDLAGITYEAQDGFMNSISGITNPEGGSMYWSYWQWNGREWLFKNTGAGEANVTHSSIEAWFFTSWDVFPSIPPTFIPNLSEICGMPVLKDYTIQPYLAYNDYSLNHKIFGLLSGQTATAETEPPENEITQTQAPIVTSPPIEQPDDQRSILPVLIIGGVGIVVVFMAIFYLRKEQR